MPNEPLRHRKPQGWLDLLGIYLVLPVMLLLLLGCIALSVIFTD